MPMQKSDPDLGVLEFQDVEGLLSYNCKMTLPISRKQVEIFFETNSIDKLPSSTQKKFLQYVVDNYNKVLLLMIDEFPKEIDFFGNDKLSFLLEKFDLDTLGIPLNIEEAPQWDLSLINCSDKSISVLANFDNMQPKKVWVEKIPKRPLLLSSLLKWVRR